ncbi:MAG: hypothetical protein AAGI03_05410 [Pseudomonadota bacterium]
MAGILFLAVNFGIFMLVWTSGSNHPLASMLMAISYLMSSALYAAMLHRPELRPIQFMALLYWTYSLTLPGLYQLRTNDFFWPSLAISEDLANVAALITLLATIALFAGYASKQRVIVRGPLGQADAAPVSISPMQERRDTSVAFMLCLLVFMYCLLMIARYGQVAFFAPRDVADIALRSAMGGFNSIEVALARTFPRALAISCLAIALALVHRRQTTGRFTVLALAFACSMMASFPISAPRYFLIATLYVILTFGFPAMFRYFKTWIYIGGPVLMFLVFPALGSWNRGNNQGWQSINPVEYLSHGDLDGFQSLMNLVFLLNAEGLAFGGRILSSVFFFMPRSIWAGKAEATGVEAAEAAGYKFTNISMPLPGEFYADFGFLGLILLMFLFGRMIAWLEVSMRRTGSEIGRRAIIGVVIAGFLPIILRGPLLSTLQASVLAIGLIVAWDVARRLRRSGVQPVHVHRRAR